jgi:flagellar biosynthesis protein FlhB
MISSKFWAAIACVGIFYLISYIAQNVIALIPYIFGMVNIFTDLETNTTPEPMAIQKTMTVMMLAIFLLTFLVSSILNVVLQLNQGIVYYSLKEDNENINTKSDIDLIGSGE